MEQLLIKVIICNVIWAYCRNICKNCWCGC